MHCMAHRSMLCLSGFNPKSLAQDMTLIVNNSRIELPEHAITDYGNSIRGLIQCKPVDEKTGHVHVFE